jgi:hypothetical protein
LSIRPKLIVPLMIARAIQATVPVRRTGKPGSHA